MSGKFTISILRASDYGPGVMINVSHVIPLFNYTHLMRRKGTGSVDVTDAPVLYDPVIRVMVPGYYVDGKHGGGMQACS